MSRKILRTTHTSEQPEPSAKRTKRIHANLEDCTCTAHCNDANKELTVRLNKLKERTDCLGPFAEHLFRKALRHYHEYMNLDETSSYSYGDELLIRFAKIEKELFDTDKDINIDVVGIYTSPLVDNGSDDEYLHHDDLCDESIRPHYSYYVDVSTIDGQSHTFVYVSVFTFSSLTNDIRERWGFQTFKLLNVESKNPDTPLNDNDMYEVTCEDQLYHRCKLLCIAES